MKKFFPATEHKHYADAVNPLAREICWNLVAASGFAKIVVDTVNTQQVWYSADYIVNNKKVLDLAEKFVVSNILIWSVGMSIKPPKSNKYVSWHQDATYSPYGGGAMVRSVAQLRVVVGAQFT